MFSKCNAFVVCVASGDIEHVIEGVSAAQRDRETKDRGIERKRETEKKGKKERVIVCERVSECVRERERKREIDRERQREI
jgi:hypothetical protein